MKITQYRLVSLGFFNLLYSVYCTELQKRKILRNVLPLPKLRHLRQIAIDEISIRAGRR